MKEITTYDSYKNIYNEVNRLLAIETGSDEEDDEINEKIADLIKNSHAESLFQLVKHGPVYDGNVISKSLRDDLIKWKFAGKGCYKGEEGYTYANYHGARILRIITKITDKWSLTNRLRLNSENYLMFNNTVTNLNMNELDTVWYCNRRILLMDEGTTENFASIINHIVCRLHMYVKYKKITEEELYYLIDLYKTAPALTSKNVDFDLLKDILYKNIIIACG